MESRTAITRRALLASGASVGVMALLPGSALSQSQRRPNFILVLCDDLGYGDVGATGGGTIRTPNLDRMAREGAVLTDFYSPANLCTPARAGYLTGRYPVRTGLGHAVILQNDRRGLPHSEVTIAEALKPHYASALIGKWHLGHVAPFWPPTNHGFDLFFGLPYSHDMDPLSLFEDNGPGVELTQEDVDYPQLQHRFLERALRFIDDNRSRPFFLTLALSAPHLASHPHPDFAGQSHAGSYGDVVEEVDALAGRLLAHLQERGLDEDTLVIFTSDNGPWFEGSSGPLRARKGGAGYDGGYRVPFIARMPRTIPAGLRSGSISMGIDLLPTFCAMAGVPLTPGLEVDGRDIQDVLTSGSATPHEQLVLFDNEDAVAIRTQRWKYVSTDYYRALNLNIEGRGYPQLYDMADDPGENYSVAERHQGVVAEMQTRLRNAQQQFAPYRTVDSTIWAIPVGPPPTD